MNRLRWGILSTARIAREKVIPAIQASTSGLVTAIASRSIERARTIARLHGIGSAYGSYEALLESAEVDAVYIPLPNHLHVDWTIRCLASNKHVLCEKPIGLNAADTRRLLEASARHPHLFVAEAFMYRHHPQWQMARNLVSRGLVGKIRMIHSFFTYYNIDPGNIRNQFQMGGGALMDIGCYNVSLSRYLFGREPIRVCASIDLDAGFGTDRMTSALLDFADGTATFSCATQLHRYQRVHVLGEEGRLEVEVPFNAPPDRTTRIWHATASGIETITISPADQYGLQTDAFARSVFHGVREMPPLQDSLANMRVIDALFESAQGGRWISI